MTTTGVTRRGGYEPHARIRMWFEIYWRFQDGQVVQAQEVADEYGVSLRTAERWLHQLSQVFGVGYRTIPNGTPCGRKFVWGFKDAEETPDGMD